VSTCQPVFSSPWANVAVVLTAAGALVFVCSYAWLTRGAWRTSVMGKHVMTFMVAILIVSLLAVAGIIWGTNWPYRTAIRTAAWGLIGGCLWWRVFLLFHVQHTDDDQTTSSSSK
jgi:membrane associated rhomboid family serine protease